MYHRRTLKLKQPAVAIDHQIPSEKRKEEEDKAGMEKYCKGKSVACVHNSLVPEEDITKTNVLLSIDCIDEIKNLEGDQVQQQQQQCTDDVKNLEGEHLEGEEKEQRKSCGFAVADIVKPASAKYYVSVSLENLLDGEYCCKGTRDRRRLMQDYLIRWAPTGIKFDIDFLKIHESVLKLEVIRHYEKSDLNVPYDEVGTSCGAKVVGRARIPLWDFLQGDLKKPVSADFLSGEENRSKVIQLVKMDGSDPENQGLLQVHMTVNKVIKKPTKVIKKPTKVIKPTKRCFSKVLIDTLGWISGSPL